MQKNGFKRWKPLTELPAEMYFKEILDFDKGLRLLLKSSDDPNQKLLQIIFESPLVYRNIDEGNLIFYNRIDEEDNLGRWGFFTINASDYLEWFHHVSQNIHKNEKITHYAIYTIEDCLDILSNFPPSVKWIKHF